MDERYLVIEIQKNEGVISNITTAYNTLAEAQHQFYIIAAAAVISSVEKHSVVLLDEDGILIERKMFVHVANAIEE